MQILSIATEDIHTDALRQARSKISRGDLPGSSLYAVLDDETTNWVNRIWDKVEGAILRAYRVGLEAAQPIIEEVSSMMREAAESIAGRAEDVRVYISDLLNEYLKGVIDRALLRVRPEIRIGDNELGVTTITVQQRITLSGSIKASLEEVCAFVASGELSVAAVYGYPG